MQFSVFPRFIFDHFTDRDIKLLLSDAQERTKVNEVLIKCCKDNGFDGLVLEVWSQLAGRIDDKILYALVLQMGRFSLIVLYNLLYFIIFIASQPKSSRSSSCALFWSFLHFARTLAIFLEKSTWTSCTSTSSPSR